MATIPNRSTDLSASGERARKHRGNAIVSKARIGNVTIPDPNPDWCSAAKMVWDGGLESGGSSYYSSADYAVLYVACDQLDHLYSQGGRRSPEFLRVITTMLASLLFTEADRRRVHVELEQGDGSLPDLALVVQGIFNGDEGA